jgi:putative cardiolipin synthase
MIDGPEARHPRESAFRLLNEGTEAFVVRMQSARLAARSLDIQTYIWHSDLTGTYLAQQLLESADRGVRVRLLLDDLDARAKNDGLAALAAHPNIEVRMFNPLCDPERHTQQGWRGRVHLRPY